MIRRRPGGRHRLNDIHIQPDFACRHGKFRCVDFNTLRLLRGNRERHVPTRQHFAVACNIPAQLLIITLAEQIIAVHVDHQR
ncbi:hypothetical protein D3C80_1261500 [compost metagenome]